MDGLERLVAAVRSAPGKLAVMCGTGMTMSTDGVLAEWLRWVLLIITGSLDRAAACASTDGAGRRLRVRGPTPPRSPPPARRVGPSCGACSARCRAVALADEIEAGNVRALVDHRRATRSPRFPQPERMRAALASLDVLAVRRRRRERAHRARDPRLPAAGQLERADVTMAANLSVRSAVLSTAAVVPPAAARLLSAWWILGSLARRWASTSSAASTLMR